MPTPNSGDDEAPSSGKRRRLEDRGGKPLASQSAHERRLGEEADKRYYDPEQNPDERRQVRREMRDLARDFAGKISAFSI